ncbi:nitroreductase/quinone reductase family protein [Sphaerisporangium fuscum]|uniref:nitroreductase/quinone reductase family protein n=1 Tax=Sphaerisporangium fuscum TaxID=2835868 RepID=UPI001BDDC774|nr:nitroreductase/quinone reductase family protein [Sphaerisporangium fuscum]
MSMPDDIRAINRAVVEEFRANGGRVTTLEMLRDADLVLLTTTGAKTGRPHTSPLGYFTDGPGRIFLWASAMAAPSHPAWYHNLVAHPRVTVELRTGEGVVESFEGTATTAKGAERERLLGIIRSTRPEIAAHQDRTDREIPVVVVEYAG